MLALLVPGVGMGGSDGGGPAPTVSTYQHVGLSRGVITPGLDSPGQAD